MLLLLEKEVGFFSTVFIIRDSVIASLVKC